MTYDEFIKLAHDMRLAQKEYFKTRKPSQLNAARDYERRVDTAIAKYQIAQSEAAAPRLF